MKESVSICWKRGHEVKLYQWFSEQNPRCAHDWPIAWRSWKFEPLGCLILQIGFSLLQCFCSTVIQIVFGGGGGKWSENYRYSEEVWVNAVQIQLTSAHVCDSRTKAYSEWPNWMVTKRFAPCSCLHPPPSTALHVESSSTRKWNLPWNSIHAMKYREDSPNARSLGPLSCIGKVGCCRQTQCTHQTLPWKE